MLSKEHRLRRDKEISTLFQKGKSVGNRHLVLKYQKLHSNEPLKVAFIISKKTAKSAVKRNRAKRQLRDIVRRLVPNLSDSHHAAFVIKSAFSDLTPKEKQATVEHLLSKAKLLSR